jgi:hypothetical protein
MQLSRLRGTQKAVGLTDKGGPYCLACRLSIEPPHDLWRIEQDLPFLESSGILNGQSIKTLTHWK